ncbi:MAG: hypothetical protein MUQ32_01500 [Chloroflexi bacterium]|nr:hypothetical protein [Chloroflexota bacterium]
MRQTPAAPADEYETGTAAGVRVSRGPDRAVTIEHEDTELPGVVGLIENARALREAAVSAGV